MEKLLKYLAEQNKYFDPKDTLSKLISQTLGSAEDELGEDDLFYVQAARGSTMPPSPKRLMAGPIMSGCSSRRGRQQPSRRRLNRCCAWK